MADNYVWAYFEKLPWKGGKQLVNSRSITLATEISHDVLSLTIIVNDKTMQLLQNNAIIALFRRLNIWKMVSLEFTERHTHLRGGGGLGADFHVWLTQYVCSTW